MRGPSLYIQTTKAITDHLGYGYSGDNIQLNQYITDSGVKDTEKQNRIKARLHTYRFKNKHKRAALTQKEIAFIDHQVKLVTLNIPNATFSEAKTALKELKKRIADEARSLDKISNQETINASPSIDGIRPWQGTKKERAIAQKKHAKQLNEANPPTLSDAVVSDRKFFMDGSYFETLKELHKSIIHLVSIIPIIDKGGEKMIVNYEKAVEYLVEAYKNGLKDDGDFLAAELNDNIGGGNISVVTYNEETNQLEVDDDQYIPN